MRKKKPVNELQTETEVDGLFAAKGSKWKVKRHFADDAKSITKIGHLICRTQSELYERTLPSKFHVNGKAPATCVDVLDVESDETFMLICNTVLASKLQSAGSPLAGRFFEINLGSVEAGKRYRTVEVDELEEEE